MRPATSSRVSPFAVRGSSWKHLLVPVAAVLLSAASQTQPPSTTLIRDAVLIDGTGSPGASGRRPHLGRSDRGRRTAHARARRGRRRRRGVRRLRPGFIDTHSHHDRGLETAPDAVAMVSQGVTTIVVGQDGGGADLAAPVRAPRASAGVGERGVLRRTRRHAPARAWARTSPGRRPADEVERMKALVKTEMDAGAIGLSTGLEYDPGIYSAPGRGAGTGEGRRQTRAAATSATSAARIDGSGRRSTSSSPSAASTRCRCRSRTSSSACTISGVRPTS